MSITITKNELAAKIIGMRGVSFARAKTVTEPDMNKTGNPFHGLVEKVSDVRGIVGNWNYARSVQNQLDRESIDVEFVPHERKWGNRIEGTGIVEHKGKMYVEMKVEGTGSEPEYRWKNSGILLTESELSELKKFLRKSAAPATQESIEKKIVLRDYKLDSIVEFNFQNEKFKIV